uniref:Uncharacterized protein n=1 Tax=Trichinella nativa TaxID=6335 RepID=A0A0V1KI40_9BILA
MWLLRIELRTSERIWPYSEAQAFKVIIYYGCLLTF